MGWWARLFGRDDPADEFDDDYDPEGELDGEDWHDTCPSFDCGCKPCALLARLSVHEAGHVVTYLALQVLFDHVYVSVDSVGAEADGRVVDGEYHHIEGDELVDHIVITMAGAAAETLVYGDVAMADGDDEAIEGYITGDIPHGTIVGLSLDCAEAEAADIVDEWYFHAIRVARELFDRGTLSYSDVLELTGVAAA